MQCSLNTIHPRGVPKSAVSRSHEMCLENKRFPRCTSTYMKCDQQPVRAEGTHRPASMLLISTGSYLS